ncbi:hypothetical protein KP803_13670 [Vibrio sp. ZSDE26]|uniref:Uncharacterized protein n=1 Tax=Vibrio amylolyticus TaxID=2847292 RepID=A0A9X1XRL8_9VIBR|nr:hypothetical protein [Vibrio amylolyticus]MCK6264324.1 hypothetical protein [Vibrio amylolyticus]
MHPALKVLSVIAALTIGFFANDLRQLASSTLQEPSPLSIEDYCLVSTQPCEQSQVLMTLDKDTVQPLVPSTLTVEWKDSNSETLALDMKGLEMDMGSVKYLLTATEGNLYQAEIMLPICTEEKMTWVGTLTDGHHTVFPAIRIER